MNKTSSQAKSKSRPHTSQLDDMGKHFGLRVRALRNERGWSLEALSSTSGVSRSMLSQIERDKANPTLTVALRIAHAFGMSLGDLADLPGACSGITAIRAGDRAYHYRSDAACRIRTLSPLNLEKDVEFYEVQLQRGGELRSSPHFEGTREFLTVQKGRVRVESDKDSDVLNRGDSVTYRADVAHAIVNVGRSEATVLLVDIYR